MSDRNAAIATAFGVSRLGGWLPSKRVTFVIDKQGIIRHIFNSQIAFDRHISESLATLRSLNAQASA